MSIFKWITTEVPSSYSAKAKSEVTFFEYYHVFKERCELWFYITPSKIPEDVQGDGRWYIVDVIIKAKDQPTKDRSNIRSVPWGLMRVPRALDSFEARLPDSKYYRNVLELQERLHYFMKNEHACYKWYDDSEQA